MLKLDWSNLNKFLKLDWSSLNKILKLYLSSLDSFRNNPTLWVENVSLAGTLMIFANDESHLGILWEDRLAFVEIEKKYVENAHQMPSAQMLKLDWSTLNKILKLYLSSFRNNTTFWVENVSLVRPCVRRKFPNFSFSRVSEMFGFRSSEIFR